MFFRNATSSAVIGSLIVLGAVSLPACGGAQKEPEAPALLPADSEKEQAPSSGKVKAGIESIKAEKFADAVQVLSEAVKEAPEDPQAAYYLGIALEGVEKYADAEVSYRKALELMPKLTEASQNLSALLLGDGRFEEAVAAADQGLGVTPEDAGLLVNRAIALGELKKPEAPAAFQKALEKQPDNAWLRLNFAQALLSSGKTAEAKSELSKITITEEQLASEVAAIYGKLEDFPACISVLDAALGKFKSDKLLIRRGVCRHGKNDEAGALADFQAALALDPKSAAAHYYIGRHMAASGKRAEAEKHLEEAKVLGKGTNFEESAQKALDELKKTRKTK